MKIEMNDQAMITVVMVIALIVMAIIAVAGCHTDNRVRTKPTVSHYQNPELRLHLTRMMWAEAQMRHYEDSKETD